MSELTREFNYLMNHKPSKKSRVSPIIHIILKQLAHGPNDLERLKQEILQMSEYNFREFLALYEKLVKELKKILKITDEEKRELQNLVEEKMHLVDVKCPTCQESKRLEVPEKIIDRKNNTIYTISIPKDCVCQHTFQVFMDRLFTVRGSQEVDYEIKNPK